MTTRKESRELMITVKAMERYKDYLAVIRTWARRDNEKQKTCQRPEVGVPVYEPYVENGLDTETQRIMEETLKKLKNV